MLYALKDGKLFEWSAGQQLCSTAPALSPGFATLGDRTARFLQIDRPAMSRDDVVEPDDGKNNMRKEVSSEVKLCLEKSPCVL